MIIGKSFPDFLGGKILDAADAQKIIDSFNISDTNTKIRSDVFNADQLNNIYKNGWIYRFIKNDPEAIAKNFTPEQAAILKDLDEKNRGNQNSLSLGLATAKDSNGKTFMSK